MRIRHLHLAAAGDPGRDGESAPHPGSEPAKPNMARVYRALPGKKDGFTADWTEAGGLAEILPNGPALPRMNQASAGRAGRHVAGGELSL